jgi:phosphoribosylamine---glycine ligase
VQGTLDQATTEWDSRFALGVVMASANYPETPKLGDEITGLPGNVEDGHVFHAGTSLKDGKVVTSGGRVLCVTALGADVKSAQQAAYRILESIKFEGAQHRQDIGYRAISD